MGGGGGGRLYWCTVGLFYHNFKNLAILIQYHHQNEQLLIVAVMGRYQCYLSQLCVMK